MVARAEPLPSAERVAAFAVAAALLFVGVWAVLHNTFYARVQVDDTPLYERYGKAMLDGEIPYRDFEVEYPPAALPMFLLPAPAETYRPAFEGVMGACGTAILLALAAALRSLRGSLWPLAFVAVAPLILGTVVLSRYDLWPTLLVVGALALVVTGHLRLGHAALGLGAAAKLFPGVLLPVLVAYAWRTRGRREAMLCLASFFGMVAAWFLPFVAIAPGGIAHSIGTHLSRPLQIESLGASFLLVSHHLFGLDIEMKSSHGSQNLAGTLPAVLAVLSSAVQLAILVTVFVWFARGAMTRERLLLASAAALTTFVAFGKVLSPQFMIWLIPVIPLVRGRRGIAASAVLAVALLLTQLWFPYNYWELAHEFDERASWFVLARDLVLVALVAILVSPLRPGRARSA